MSFPKTTVALATAGALSLAALPVVAQEFVVAQGGQQATAHTDGISPDAADTDETSPADVNPSERILQRQGGHLEAMVDRLGDDFARDLAAELDLHTDEVAEAIDRVRGRWTQEFLAENSERIAQWAEQARKHLDRAVEDGVVTREQADALSELLDGEQLGPGMLGDLSDEQRAALEALRDEAADTFRDLALGEGRPDRHPGPGGPGGWFGPRVPSDDMPSGDDPAQEPSPEAT